MKIFAFVLTVVGTTALNAVGSLLLVLTAPGDLGVLFLVPIAGFTIMSVCPVLIGSFAAYWDIRAESHNRRYFRRLLVVVGFVQALAAGSIAWFAVVDGTPAWVAIALIGALALLSASATPIGSALYRWELNNRPHAPVWAPVAHGVIRKKIMIIAGVLVGFVLVAALASALVGEPISESEYRIASLSLMVAAFACTVVAVSLNKSVREITRRDLTLTRTVTRAIFGRRRVVLTGEEPLVAVRVAAVVALTLPFQTANLVLFFAGLSLQWLGNLALEQNVEFARIGLAVFVPLAVGALVLSGLRIRRVRRYLSDHADLLHQLAVPPWLPSRRSSGSVD